MKKFSALSTVILVLFAILVGCNKDNNDPVPNTGDPIDNVTLKDPVNKFVWKGMNSWYNWQTNVPALADTKDDDLNSFNTYLNTYNSPEDLFESLMYNKGTTDRFSWIVDNYIELNNSFQGITKTFGFRLQAVSITDEADPQVVFYVRHVAPNSPASNAGIERGAIFNSINGTVVRSSNYSAVVGNLSNESVTLGFVTVNNGNLVSAGEKTISAVVLAEDPVHFRKVFTDINGKKVGYLVYTGFRSSYNDELNAAFAYFASEGIDELVLDLRINGGGSVLTSAYLASMIYGAAGVQVFASLDFNQKHPNQNGTYTFQNRLNVYNENGEKTGEEDIVRLNTLSRLYVLTSGSTASASEMIINGLKPFMPVYVIGTTTYGKNVGSITLYDSPTSDYTSQSSASASHLYAMQPIVFQIFNKSGQSDYTQGFVPDIEIKEWYSWDNILPYGDENEVVLKTALDHIKGLSSKISLDTERTRFINKMDISKLDKRFDKEMYIDNDFFNN